MWRPTLRANVEGRLIQLADTLRELFTKAQTRMRIVGSQTLVGRAHNLQLRAVPWETSA